MGFLNTVVGFVLFSLTYITYSDAILCFNCGDTKSKGPCQMDIEGLMKTRKHILEKLPSVGPPHINSIHVTNCSHNISYCGIEKVSEGGHVSSYIRGCFDVDKFSDDSKSSILNQLSTDNQTLCAFVNKRQICRSLCDADLCNGPWAGGSRLYPTSIFVASIVALAVSVSPVF
ncbi:hypothetical protein ScPMuIL_009578 [Solemya velum]